MFGGDQHRRLQEKMHSPLLGRLGITAILLNSHLVLDNFPLPLNYEILSLVFRSHMEHLNSHCSRRHDLPSLIVGG